MNGDPLEAGPKDTHLTSVAIVDDHTVLVDAMQMIIQAQKDITVVGTGRTCAETMELVRRLHPEVLILDNGLPDGSGIDLLPEIKTASPQTNVLILTSLNDENAIRKAMDTGASGFLHKSLKLPEILAAIRKAASDEIVMHSSLLAGVLNRTPVERSSTRLQITVSERELEILRLLSRGETVDQVAGRLNISLSTARTHLRNLMQKMDVHSQLQAVTVAIKSGWIEAPV